MKTLVEAAYAVMTKENQEKRKDKTMKKIVGDVKHQFKEHMVDKDCGVSYDHDQHDPKVSYLNLTHHDLMDEHQRKTDLDDLHYHADKHPDVTKTENIPDFGAPSFRDYRSGAMPSITIKVHHQ